MTQTGIVRSELAKAFGFDEAEAEDAFEIRVITTTGDKLTKGPLRDVGGKGLFTKELDEALLGGEIDAAVHSMKDVPTHLPDGMVIGGLLERADPRDGLVGGDTLADFAPGSVIGTASLRRTAQVLARRPDLVVKSLRGNVDTRLGKVKDGSFAGTILAMAGLGRLGKGDAAVPVGPEDMLPAIAQGAVGIAVATDNADACAAVAAISIEEAVLAVALERGFLSALDGSCRTPIAGLAEAHRGTFRFRGQLLMPDGTDTQEIEHEASPTDEAGAWAEGFEIGKRLRVRVGEDYMRRLATYV